MESTQNPTHADEQIEAVAEEPSGQLVAEDLIEDVSIDGMCGVY